MRSLSSRLELGFEDEDRARMVVYNDILDAGFLHVDIEFIMSPKYPKKGVDKKPNKIKSRVDIDFSRSAHGASRPSQDRIISYRIQIRPTFSPTSKIVPYLTSQDDQRSPRLQ